MQSLILGNYEICDYISNLLNEHVNHKTFITQLIIHTKVKNITVSCFHEILWIFRWNVLHRGNETNLKYRSETNKTRVLSSSEDYFNRFDIFVGLLNQRSIQVLTRDLCLHLNTYTERMRHY